MLVRAHRQGSCLQRLRIRCEKRLKKVTLLPNIKIRSTSRCRKFHRAQVSSGGGDLCYRYGSAGVDELASQIVNCAHSFSYVPPRVRTEAQRVALRGRIIF